MGRKRNPISWIMPLQYRHMRDCFGKGKWNPKCSCPEQLQPICRKTKLTEEYSPRVNRGFGNLRPYTPTLNFVFRGKWWSEGGATKFEEPSDSIKFTFAFLLTFTQPNLRWIPARFEKLAALRGISLRRFQDHCRCLQRVRMIRLIRMRDLSIYNRSNRYTIVIRDIPKYFRGGSDALKDLRSACAKKREETPPPEFQPEFDGEIEEEVNQRNTRSAPEWAQPLYEDFHDDEFPSCHYEDEYKEE